MIDTQTQQPALTDTTEREKGRAMRLRENAIHLKFTTYADVLNQGDHEALIDRIEAACGGRYDTFRDLAGTRLPLTPLNERRPELLGAHTGAGLHQTARFQLQSEHEALGALEITAGLHPYSGVYATQVNARLSTTWAERNTEELIELAMWCIAIFEPLTLHVHDVDDDAIQNIDNPRLLELGYGIVASCAPEDRPGREAVRGQFRLSIAWLTYFGPDALALLSKAEVPDALDVNVQRLGRGTLYRLARRPSEAGTPEFRARQKALRQLLEIDALIERDRHAHAYWKKKS